jgi:hypothetical protein
LSSVDLSDEDKSALFSLPRDFGLSSVSSSLLISFVTAGLSSCTFCSESGLALVSFLSDTALALVSVAASSLTL